MTKERKIHAVFRGATNEYFTQGWGYDLQLTQENDITTVKSTDSQVPAITLTSNAFKKEWRTMRELKL